MGACHCNKNSRLHPVSNLITCDFQISNNPGDISGNASNVHSFAIQQIIDQANSLNLTYQSLVLILINKIREDPKSYANFLKSALTHVIVENDTYYYNHWEDRKIKLRYGWQYINIAIQKWNNAAPLEKWTWNEDLYFDFSQEEEFSNRPNSLNNLSIFLSRRKKDLKEQYPNMCFNWDWISDPIWSVFVQIIDEGFDGKRCNAILSKNIRYCNITIDDNEYFKGFTSVIVFA